MTTSDPWAECRRISEELGKQVAAERESRGWTLGKTCSVLNQHQQTTVIDSPSLSRLERGHLMPSAKLAAILVQNGFAIPSAAPTPIAVPTPARRSDPSTSRDAAKAVNLANAAGLHRWLLTVLHNTHVNLRRGTLRLDVANRRRTHQGLLDFHRREPPNAVAWTSDSGLRTRLSELRAAGLVVDTGDRVRLDTGRMAIVWTITELGIAELKHHTPLTR